MKQFFQQNKKIIVTLSLVLALSLGLLLLADLHPVSAVGLNIWTMVKEGFWSLLVWIGNFIRFIFGKLLLVLLKLLVFIGSYNGFTTSPYVKSGWKILRDVVNMFFILGLLFIAFVTVLKIEKYQWNKFLGRLLIMAILVNFSNTICGLIIDFFQVLMLTFINSFRDIAEGTIFKGLGMTDTVTTKFTEGADVAGDAGMIAAAATLMGAAFIVVACLVVGIFTIMLAFRMVALWMLIVVSPLAFFSYAFESVGGKIGSISGRWWTQFFNYCMIGPFMAFFLWLSLITMAAATGATGAYGDTSSLTAYKFCETTLCSAEQLVPYLMGILMLVGGLMMSGEFAVAGSGLATRAASSIKNTAQAMVERPAGMAYGLGKAATVGVAVGGAGIAYRNIVQPTMKGISSRYQAAGGVIGLGKRAVSRVVKAPQEFGAKLAERGKYTDDSGQTKYSTLGNLGRAARFTGAKAEAMGGAAKRAYQAPGKKLRQKIQDLEESRKTSYAQVGKAGLKGGEQLLGLAGGMWSGAKKKLAQSVLGGGAILEKAVTFPVKTALSSATAGEREYNAKRIQAGIPALINEDPTELMKVDQERTKEIKLPGINLQDMTVVGKEIDDMVSGAIPFEKIKMMILVEAMAEGGGLGQDRADAVRSSGFLHNESEIYQQKYGEKIEGLTKKATGAPISFNNIVSDSETGQFINVTKQKNNRQRGLEKMIAKGDFGDLKDYKQVDGIVNNFDGSLFKKGVNGKMQLAKDSKEYKRLDALGDDDAEKKVFKGLQTAEGHYNKNLKDLGIADSNGNIKDARKKDESITGNYFDSIARTSETNQTLSKQRVTSLATMGQADADKTYKNKNNLNIGNQSASSFFTDYLGLIKNQRVIGGQPEPTNKRTNLNSTLLNEDNDKRLDLIKDKDNREFIPDLVAALESKHGSVDNLTEKNVADYFEDKDKLRAKMSLQDMEAAQEYQVATSSKYDNDGRMKTDGAGERNPTLDARMQKMREKEGPEAGLKESFNEAATDSTLTANDKQVLAATPTQDALIKTLGDQLLDVIRSAKQADTKGEQIGQIRDYIKDTLVAQNVGISASGADQFAQKIANKVLSMESKFERQSKAVSAIKTTSGKDFSPIKDFVDQTFGDGKSTGVIDPLSMKKIDLKLNSFYKKISSTVSKQAVPESALNLKSLMNKIEYIRQQIKPMANNLNTMNTQQKNLQTQIKSTTDEKMKKELRAQSSDLDKEIRRLEKDWEDNIKEIDKIFK